MPVVTRAAKGRMLASQYRHVDEKKKKKFEYRVGGERFVKARLETDNRVVGGERFIEACLETDDDYYEQRNNETAWHVARDAINIGGNYTTRDLLATERFHVRFVRYARLA